MERINHNGYVEIYIPNHHRSRGNGYVFLHIVIAEAKIGRRLIDGEQVHHIDENKQNNDPENLDVISIGAHTKLHSSTKKKGEYLFCGHCGVKYYVKPSMVIKSKYCNRSCKAKGQNRGGGMFSND